MFCPVCRNEKREGISICPECNVPLVDELPPEQEPEYMEFTPVFSTANPVLIAMAKSILQDAGIQYTVKGENLQNLFGYGLIGIGFNPVTGVVEIQVDVPDYDEARELLKYLEIEESA
ncbi:DUF2007 domain-containing protein [bacterium]|nr:DUF2007 domain-containing protein [bacterium]